MIISEPRLPPKAGYIEIEVDGVRQYQKIETEQDKQIADLTQLNAALQEQYLMLDGAFSDFLIDGLPAIIESIMMGE